VALDTELNRDVALKEIQPRFADDPRHRARFEFEAEVTGRLEHPGIVPVYGLGHTPEGRPFYAMRLIKGSSLREAVRDFHQAENQPGRDPGQRALELRELLGRFMDVCDAVAYAHSRGVLHRDLKPSNIMLGKYGETLVVDWGLAKALDQPEPGSSIDRSELPLRPSSGSHLEPTLAGSAVGTPAYMSPEQVDGQIGNLGIHSDVYCLGATLYHLLTGHAPCEAEAVGEVYQKVLAGAIPRPRALSPRIAPALEAICLKAMAPQPEDRYDSAERLKIDLERWMADEPVSAYREPWPLRARRWMRRHRTLVTSTAAVLIFGLAGLASFATVLAGKNRELDAKNGELAGKNQELDRQRQRAEEREALAIDAVTKFRDAVQANAELKNRPELDALRKALLKEPLEFFGNLRDQLQSDRDTRAAALEKLARANFDLASTTAEIGSIPDAIRSYSESLAIREWLARDHPAVTRYLIDLARCHHNLGNMLGATGRATEALESYRRALAIKERVARDHPAVSEYQIALASTLNNLGVLLINTGQPAEAIESHRRALEIHERLARENPSDTRFQSLLAESLDNFGILRNHTGQPAEALESHQRALAINERLARENPSVDEFWLNLAGNHNNIGFLLSQSGRPAEALESHRRALAIQQRVARDNPTVSEYRRDLAASHSNFANLLGDTGHPSEAMGSYRQALELWERLVRDHPAVTEYQRGLAITHNNIGSLLNDTGQPAEALESFRRSLEVRERLARDHPSLTQYQTDLGLTLGNLAEIEIGLGQWQEARRRLDRALALERKALAALPRHPSYQRAIRTHLIDLARVHQALNQPAEAVGVARELAALARGNPKDLYNVACVLALSVPLTHGVEQQALAAEAIRTLQEAIVAGWSDAGQAARDPDLAPLHDRDDFRRMLAQLFDRDFPAHPFAP
jgi:serine/threonine-protein kinase